MFFATLMVSTVLLDNHFRTVYFPLLLLHLDHSKKLFLLTTFQAFIKDFGIETCRARRKAGLSFDHLSSPILGGPGDNEFLLFCKRKTVRKCKTRRSLSQMRKCKANVTVGAAKGFNRSLDFLLSHWGGLS